ncbi:hypothetical protein ALPO108162_05020 [Alicyclobacillus pomorum]|jgi:hypothetical protein
MAKIALQHPLSFMVSDYLTHPLAFYSKSDAEA